MKLKSRSLFTQKYRRGMSYGQSTAKFLIIALSILFICVLILLGIAGVFFIPISKTVYVVNGLEKEYSVQINGETPIKVPPGIVKEFQTSASELDVTVISDDYDIPSFKAEQNTRLYSHLLNNDVLVLNPDAGEIIGLDTVIYIERRVKEEDYPPMALDYYGGKQKYEFEDIDFAFQNSPDEMSLGDFEDYTLKKELRLLENLQYYGTSDKAVYETEGYDVAMLNRYEYDKDWDSVKYALQNALEEDEYIKLTREMLSDYPLSVQNHREHQSFLNNKERFEEVEQYYRDLLAKYPNDKDAMYLLGRVTPDVSEMIRLNRFAIQEPSPCIWGHLPLGFEAMTNARFDEAYAHFKAYEEKAEEDDQYNATSYYYYLDYATGNYEEIRKTNREYVDEYGVDEDSEVEEILALCLMNRWDEAHTKRVEAISQLAKEYEYEESDAYVIEYGEWIKALMLSIQGQHDQALDAYLNYYGEPDDEGTNYGEYLKLLKNGKPREAFEGYFETEDEYDYLNFDSALTIAAIAHRIGDFELEKQMRDRAAAMVPDLYNYNARYVNVQKWLEGDTTIDPAELIDLSIYQYQKVALLLYIGEVAPAYRQKAWALAMQLKCIPMNIERSVLFPLMGYNGPLIPNNSNQTGGFKGVQ